MSLKNNSKNKKDPKGKKQPNFYWIYLVILLVLVGISLFNYSGGMAVEKIDQQTMLDEMYKIGDVEKLEIVGKNLRVNVTIKEDRLSKEPYAKIAESKLGGINKGPHFWFYIGDQEVFNQKLNEYRTANNLAELPIDFNNDTNWASGLISLLFPLAIIILLWLFIMRRMSGVGGAGGQIFNIGKSKAKLLDGEDKVNVTFKDVAGLEEAKEEVMEVVSFLKTPRKYTALGAKIPKGVLLVGPPGTGKTLLAKAVAGEAKVPFFSISGSDFVEMFVGVGASRVRDLFKQAREKAPCIIFIDEIDAIGRARGKNMMQNNDERENTLNQLLVEMDGFDTDKGVIIMAATNRPDVLDMALLRPGRFDRQISVDRPDIRGRTAIFKVHLKPIKVGPDVDAEKLAAQTPGFAGAEIANVCNEAALIAARKEKKEVEMDDFNDAVDRVIGGLEKKNKIIAPEEKEIVAYHEAGHAVCGWFLEHADPLVKVSIVPRGVAALGYAQYLPSERYLMRTEQLEDRMCKTLGGRAAEEVIFNKISTGAQNDLDVVTKMAYAMVTVYGMTEKLGNVSFYDMSQDQFQKPYSDETAKVIDDEVRRIITEQYERAVALLRERKDEMELIAQELLEKEIIFKDDVERLIGKSEKEKISFVDKNGQIDSLVNNQKPVE